MATRAIVVGLLGLAVACGGESEPVGGGAGSGACTPLAELPSQQTVIIAIKNTQPVDRFVATAATGFTPVEIKIVDAVPAGWTQAGADFQGGGGMAGVAYPSQEPSAEVELPSAGNATVALEL